MTRKEATQAVFEAKTKLGLTWEEIAKKVGRHEIWTTAALLGQHPLSKEEAKLAGEILNLGEEVVTSLQEFLFNSF